MKSAKMTGSSKAGADGLTLFPEDRWDDGIIPYKFDTSVSKWKTTHEFNASVHVNAHHFLVTATYTKDALRQAADVWMNKTCLKFVEWTDQPNYLLIVEESG